MIVSEERYIAHYGIPGMKWGKRKALPESATKAKIRSTKDAIKARKDKYLSDESSDKVFDKTYDSTYNKLIKSGMKKGKAHDNALKEAISESRRVESTLHYKYKSDMKKLKSQHKQAKKDRKNELKTTYKEIKRESSSAEKMLFNNATRKKAAKYVVDNNMSISDAKSRATQDAIRNTATLLVAYGGLSLVNKYIK